ncbi:Aldolase-type TIM barrel [Moorella glycerini]|uniref:3-keto-5-aminohexanoate cleavage enzyme n=1 Tax=Neomoorella stamsii TaxID=1266720 RepID=A0A9X7J4G0_9FIRM|nr:MULTISPECIES: 3-keto-5-aminohexanoate cleavage protein [Moorella]PRR73408.1 3-keto-5-aminohexanoate cleavage enzyme [Moorella stamsii]CEP69177.1 Aldolase-type TIM barrel [Moorella glycerini]
MRKVIVTAALTGNMVVPTQTEYLPYKPDHIAEEARRCWEAGAAIIHIHPRDPENGRPVPSIELFGELLTKIKAKCDAVVCPSTGGGPGMSVEHRVAVVRRYRPEIASFNTGSMNFGMFNIVKRYSEFKFSWERDYLESTRDFVFKNTFSDLQYMGSVFRETGTKPELEIYDVGHLYNVAFMVSEGWIELPIHIQFVLGVLGGIGASIENLLHLKSVATRLFQDRFTWSVTGIGYPAEFVMATHGMLVGGHVRVGLEDNIKLSPGILAKSNAELVEKVVKIARNLDFDIATPDEARDILGLKGMDKVGY